MIEFSYRTSGQIQSIVHPTATITFGYSALTGQVTSIGTSSGLTLAYQYDGELLVREDYSGEINGSLTWDYDSNFIVVGSAVNGDSVGYAHDNDLLLVSAGSLALTRDPVHGLVVGSTLDTVTTTQSYNAFAELSTFSADASGTQLFSLELVRDSAGQIVEKRESILGENHQFNYDYDDAGRLTEVRENGVSTGGYTYDADSNRLTAGATTATYDSQDRLIQNGSKIYAYSAHGDLRSITEGGQSTNFEYDALGNLRKVVLPDGRTVEYVIDGRNRRVGKKVNGNPIQGLLYQDELRPVAELDGSGAVAARFVHLGNSNVPAYLIKGNVAYRIICDHLGSVRLVVNATTGEIAQRLDYDEFGVVLQDTSPAFQPFGFAGGLYDPDTKLVRFMTRDYDPSVGRWTAKDQLGFNGGDTNLYAYVEQDPIGNFDPTGLQKGPPSPGTYYPRGPMPQPPTPQLNQQNAATLGALEAAAGQINDALADPSPLDKSFRRVCRRTACPNPKYTPNPLQCTPSNPRGLPQSQFSSGDFVSTPGGAGLAGCKCEEWGWELR